MLGREIEFNVFVVVDAVEPHLRAGQRLEEPAYDGPVHEVPTRRLPRREAEQKARKPDDGPGKRRDRSEIPRPSDKPGRDSADAVEPEDFEERGARLRRGSVGRDQRSDGTEVVGRCSKNL